MKRIRKNPVPLAGGHRASKFVSSDDFEATSQPHRSPQKNVLVDAHAYPILCRHWPGFGIDIEQVAA